MRKILNIFATTALLCAMVFLGGEWPEDTPIEKVLTFDGAALAIVAACGIYLHNEEKTKGGVGVE